MKRKGFTLIELLAVIVILAIIALIAVPVIMNIISSARKSAFENTAYGIIKAGEMYYASLLLNDGMTNDVEFTIVDGEFTSAEKLEVSGSLPESGKITVTKNGKVAIAVNNGQYCITKATGENAITTVKYEGSCEYKRILNPIITSTATCITNGSETCSEDAIKARIDVQVKVNDKEEAKTFYVVKDDTATGTLTLIMDRNVDKTTMAWVTEADYVTAGGTAADYSGYGNTNKGPLTALNYLESKTSGWTNIPTKTYTLKDDNETALYEIVRTNARARMLTKTEALSVGCKEYNAGCPTWLYGNSKTLNESTGPYGYWLSTGRATHSFNAWVMNRNGVNYVLVYDDFSYGVRPVIEIPKTII